MKKVGLVVVFLMVIAAGFLIWGTAVRAADLPSPTYLGQGPGTFTAPEGRNFLVKRSNPFRFDEEPGPTYVTTRANERVWAVDVDQSQPGIFEEDVDLGAVEAGCIIDYVGIDDDIDGRRNRFLLNGEEIHLISEGLVFSGRIIIERDGNLVLRADDSIGAWLRVCDEQIEPTVTPTPEPTETPTPEPTATITPGPSPTATGTATPGPSPTPTNTPIPPTVTATATPPTPLPSATPTKEKRLNSCTRINFEVSGDAAVRGLYVVEETGGRPLASWYALDGWQDSGWFKEIDITFPDVYVVVAYYRGPGSEPVYLQILNHAPDSPYGWMSRGQCHAIEVGWAGGVVPEGAVAEPGPTATAVTTSFVPQSAAADQPVTSSGSNLSGG